MNLPEPSNYTDGVQYFRDSHKVVLHFCAELELLLTDAKTSGVFASFAAKPEWNSVFEFFLKEAPLHERDEEKFLFPMIAAKVPRVGFQQPGATIRFLIEGHEVLQKAMIKLVRDWDEFRKKQRDPSDVVESHAAHEIEDAEFIADGTELARLYREHAATEETQVYSVGDKVLTGRDKLQIADALRAVYDNQAMTPMPQFGEAHFTNANYTIQYSAATPPAEESAANSDFAGSD